jgi:hypothetical protein
MERSRSIDYHLAEYGLLRQELLQNFKDSYGSVTYAVLANSALVAWISSHINQSADIKELIFPASFLPVFVSITAWVLYLLRRRSIQRISDYCMKLEERFAEDELGWERFYTKRMQEKLFYIRSNWVFNAICLVQLLLSLYFVHFVLTKI